jgi:sodium/potassium-transporting ATPase subunit beta
MADDGKQPKPNCCQRFGNGLSNFGKFLYNRETGQCMGRSGESWLKIGVFYLIFYGFLAAFFSAMLTVFLSTLNDPKDGGPKLTQFLANKPGLTSMVPKGVVWKANYSDAASPTFNDSRSGLEAFQEEMKTFLAKYKGSACPDKATGRGETDCKFDPTKLGTCGVSSTVFQKAENTVCVYVKVNKVYDWVPTASKGSTYLKLKCGDPKGVTVVPEGFHIGSFPFRGGSNFELPVVALKIDVSKFDGKTINCKLDTDGTGIEVSEVSVAHRAYGQIDIEL